MRIRIVTDPSNHQAWQVVYQASRLHFKTDDAKFPSQLISGAAVLHHLVARRIETVMDNRSMSLLDQMVPLVLFGRNGHKCFLTHHDHICDQKAYAAPGHDM